MRSAMRDKPIYEKSELHVTFSANLINKVKFIYNKNVFQSKVHLPLDD